jgi:IS6 family transposase
VVVRVSRHQTVEELYLTARAFQLLRQHRSVKEKVLPADCKLRRVEYLDNIIEQDRRAIRGRWRAAQCFRSFHTAERAPGGIESMHMMRKGQVKRSDARDAVGQAKFVASLFGVAA